MDGEPLTDPMVIPAAFVATLWVALILGPFWQGIREERRKGAAPWWAYPFVPFVVLSCVGLLVAKDVWPFASHLFMAASGIFAGVFALYFGARAVLQARVWWQARVYRPNRSRR